VFSGYCVRFSRWLTRPPGGASSWPDVRSLCIVITPVLFFLPRSIPYTVYQFLDDLATTLPHKISISPSEQSSRSNDNHIIWNFANADPWLTKNQDHLPTTYTGRRTSSPHVQICLCTFNLSVYAAYALNQFYSISFLRLHCWSQSPLTRMLSSLITCRQIWLTAYPLPITLIYGE